MNNLKKALLMTVIAVLTLTAQARERRCFDADWLFILSNQMTLDNVKSDAGWRLLNLPHDWAIEGDFYAGNPSGAGGGALPGGVGWYKKSFSVPAAGDASYFIEFDGVYMNSTVWLNGHKLGSRPYGYSSFEYDMTPFINRGGENLLVVKVDNSDQPNSRWYSGCGIYRHVWMTTTSRTHVAHWGSYVTATVSKNNRKATFDVEVTLENATKATQVTNT